MENQTCWQSETEQLQDSTTDGGGSRLDWCQSRLDEVPSRIYSRSAGPPGGLHIQNFVRVNHKIRAREVRVIDVQGKQAGVMPTHQALGLAQQAGVDLVEVAPNANPPVCKLVDFGKFKYEQEKREREARKHQHATKLKEIKLRLNIDTHDYQTKLKHMVEFLQEGNKVKVSLFFRGRETAHTELGDQLMQRVVADVQSAGHVETPPRAMGRSIIMIIGPVRGAAKRHAQPVSQQAETSA